MVLWMKFDVPWWKNVLVFYLFCCFDSCISSCVRYVEYYAAEAGRRLQVLVQVPYVITDKGVILYLSVGTVT